MFKCKGKDEAKVEEVKHVGHADVPTLIEEWEDRLLKSTDELVVMQFEGEEELSDVTSDSIMHEEFGEDQHIKPKNIAENCATTDPYMEWQSDESAF